MKFAFTFAQVLLLVLIGTAQALMLPEGPLVRRANPNANTNGPFHICPINFKWPEGWSQLPKLKPEHVAAINAEKQQENRAYEDMLMKATGLAAGGKIKFFYTYKRRDRKDFTGDGSFPEDGCARAFMIGTKQAIGVQLPAGKEEEYAEYLAVMGGLFDYKREAIVHTPDKQFFEKIKVAINRWEPGVRVVQITGSESTKGKGSVGGSSKESSLGSTSSNSGSSRGGSWW